MHFSRFFQVKYIVGWRHVKLGHQVFSCRSLIASTSVLNDKDLPYMLHSYTYMEDQFYALFMTYNIKFMAWLFPCSHTIYWIITRNLILKAMHLFYCENLT